ncbi:MAG: thiamine pyrophosphate-dependent enzyme [bacterium]
MDGRVEQAASILVEQGVRHAFGVTGSGPSLALITALEALGARYYPSSHEAAGALMAGALGELSGALGVAISVRGPGLANMLPGIVHNAFERRPSLSVSEALGAETPSWRKHKRLDHRSLLAPVVKATGTLDGFPGEFLTLLAIAHQEVPGPVHLDLCLHGHRQAGGETAPATTGSAWTGSDGLKDRLAAAQHPLVIAGSLAKRATWRDGLARLQVPVFTTVAGKGALDESLPHSAGVWTGDGKELAPESLLLAQADLVLGIGLRNTEVLTAKPFGRPALLVDQAGPDLAEGFAADTVVPEATSDLIADLLGAIAEKAWGLEAVGKARTALQRSLLSAGWLPARCFAVLNQLRFSYGMVLDTGAFCTVAEHLWAVTADRYFLGSSNSRTMGVALPVAIGASIARPTAPVICVLGDGGMQMYNSELKLALEERLPLCTVLMSDGRYASVAAVPQSRPMSARAVTVPRPSWYRAVEALGGEAHRVESEEAFAGHLDAWNRSAPLFLEAVFDPVRYVAMTARLR